MEPYAQRFSGRLKWSNLQVCSVHFVGFCQPNGLPIPIENAHYPRDFDAMFLKTDSDQAVQMKGIKPAQHPRLGFVQAVPNGSSSGLYEGGVGLCL